MTNKISRTSAEELLNEVIDVARRAGEVILGVYNGERAVAVDRKADNSPVTAADVAAHELICPALGRLLEGIPVLSEESTLPDFKVRSQWDCYWIVDPLDGTKEFIERNDEFTVNIALVENGEPVLGVVCVPVSGVIYTGLKGVGAFKISANGRKKIQVRDMVKLQKRGEPVVVVSSRREGFNKVEQLLTRIRSRINDLEMKNLGSSLKFCLIAEGLADFYPRFGPTCEWDTAAAQAVVEAAGGLVVDKNMRTLRYNTKSELLNPDFYVIGDKSYYWAELLTSD